MNLQSSDFELFDLAPCFAQDSAAIDARWKELQREVHPDKFSTEGAAAQRVAMQWSVRINEAYRRLKDPLKRAAYLCELHGEPVNAENNTAMASDFLLQQMQWREELEDAAGMDELERLARQVASARQQLLQQCAQLLDEKQDYKAAVQQVRALMFIERFASDVQFRLDQMDTQ
ncbi:MAG: Fe-S protein assembly co-chaperone HscB [Comamonadaceae bacterium]|nr:MAG: Fe-S protein assembly co-chaperone HscB [Comamonadaceae bacterium]